MYCYDGTAFELNLTALELDQKAIEVFHLRPYGTCTCLSTKTSGSIFASPKEQCKCKGDIYNPHFTDDEYESSPKKKRKVSCSKSEAFITPDMQLKTHHLAQASTPYRFDSSYNPVSRSCLTGEVSILSKYKGPGITVSSMISLVFTVRLSNNTITWIWAGLAQNGQKYKLKCNDITHIRICRPVYDPYDGSCQLSSIYKTYRPMWEGLEIHHHEGRIGISLDI